MLLAGRERALIGDYVFPSLTASPNSVTSDDIESSSASTPGRAASAARPASIARCSPKAMRSAASPLRSSTCPFSRSAEALESSPGPHSVRSRNNVEGVVIDGVGHYVAMEAPNRLGDELVSFYAEIEKS
jgi:pimeloyl-ACP methyl ester carboxylesterase